MKKVVSIAKYYLLGIISTVLIIVFIHLYSYIAEPYFSYAEWNNLIQTVLMSGIPFGIAIGVFKKIKTTK